MRRGRVRREDRHRRAGDGPGRGQEPRQRRGRHRAGRVPRSPQRAGGRRLHLDAAPARWRRGPSPTSPTTTWPSPSGRGQPGRAGGHRAGRRVLARVRRRHRLAQAALRYGENPHQAAALYIDPALRPGLAHAEQLAARRCRTTTTSTPTPRGGRATSTTVSAVAIVKHNNPCGIAISTSPWRTRTARPTPATRFGLRRRHRRQRAVTRRWPASWRASSPRSSSRRRTTTPR